MIRIGICDDDLEILNTIKNHISIISMTDKYVEDDLNIFATENSDLFLQKAKNDEFDIVFLDLMMPSVDGICIANEICENNLDVLIIFVSSFENMVFSTLKYRPFRFIRKSMLNSECELCLIDAIDTIKRNCDKYTIKNYSQVTSLTINKIVYAEAHKNYLNFHYGNEVYRDRKKVSDIEKDDNFTSFVKINSGTLVNMKYIKEIKPKEIVLSTDEVLYLSERLRKKVTEEYLSYIRRNANGNTI